MKKTGVILLMLMTLTAFAAELPKPDSLVCAEVVNVVDGKTLDVVVQESRNGLESGKMYRVRLIGVDVPATPENAGLYGKEVAEFAERHLLNSTVLLELDVRPYDERNNLLAYIWLGWPVTDKTEGELRKLMFNAILILDGYARVATAPPNVKYAEYFAEFEETARAMGVGLWQNQKLEDSDVIVYVTPKGRKYHLKSCRTISNSQEIMSITLEEAKKRGYEPCRVCDPPN